MFSDIFKGDFRCNVYKATQSVVVTIDEEKFIGRTRSEIAKFVMAYLFGCISKVKSKGSKAKVKKIVDPYKITVAEHAQKMVFESYRYLTYTNSVMDDYKVIAGIVKITGALMEVVSVGSGSKFLYYNHFGYNGDTLIDCHAEVIARRGFVRYLFSELQKFATVGPANSIFEANPKTGFYKLKDGISFHLYVSTAPCGDGRVFSHADTGIVSPAGLPAGTLRTKGLEALTVKYDGTKAFTNGVFSMSCSAKIMRWNVLGLQGALLSTLIEPIYLSSIIMADKFDENHLQRALYGRIEPQLHHLPPGYRLNKPTLLEVTRPFNVVTDVGVNKIVHSCNWFCPAERMEMVDATSGHVVTHNVPSRLSKRVLFDDYLRVRSMLNLGYLDTNWMNAKLGSREYYVSLHSKNCFMNVIKPLFRP